MAVEIGSAYLAILPSLRGFGPALERGIDMRGAGTRGGDEFSTGFGGSIKKIAGLVTAAFAGVKLGGFLKDAVAQASDMNEQASKTSVVFGAAAGTVNAFAAKGAKALGMTSLAAQQAAANFGVFGKSAGLAGEDNAVFSDGMAQLAVDMASFSNTTPDQAIEALGAGLRGETEPLRAYGVLLDDASMRQEALSMGLITTTKDALTPQQKVLAAHSLILKQTSDAQGDFARTSGGLANQQRILSASWDDAKGKLGAAFLPAVTAVVSGINEKLFPALDSMMPKVQAAWATLMTGDFTGAAAGIGEEDSLLVRSLLFAHDTAVKLGPDIQAAWRTLMTGDFVGNGGKTEEDSPLIVAALKLRDFGLDSFSRLGGIFTTLRDTAKELWPSIVSIAGSLAQASASVGVSVWDIFLTLAQDLASVLQVTLVPALDAVAGFMKDHPGLVTAVVAAYTIYRLAVLGSAVATGAWTAAVWLWNAAHLVFGTSMVLTNIQVGLSLIGYYAAAVATGIWTAATWLLNAAIAVLTSPITLVVVAIAALAAGVIYAYTHFDWFKTVVQVAWDVIQNVISFAWEHVIKPVFEGIKFHVGLLIAAFQSFWSVVQFVWDLVQNAISFAWEHVIKPVFDALNAGLGVVGGWFTWLWETVRNVWTWITDKLTIAWNWIRDNVFALLNVGISVVGGWFTWLWQTVSDIWTWITDKLTIAWNWVRDNVFAPLNAGISRVGQVFSDLWATVSDVWTSISDKLTIAWNWIRDKVFAPMGDGINTIKGFFQQLWDKAKEVWGAVSGWFGDIADKIKGAVTAVASAIAQINNKIVDFTGIGSRMVDPGGVGEPGRGGGGSFARGGVIPGADPGRRDNKVMAVRSGESFFVPEFTRAIGGSATVTAWNRAAENGPDALGAAMGMPGFARGGVVDGVTAGTSQFDRIMTKANALLKAKSDEADALAVGGSGVWPDGARGKFLAAIASKMGTQYVWGADGPDVFDCSGLVSWGLRQTGGFTGRLTAEGFNEAYPHISVGKPGDLVTFDTGRLGRGQAGHMGVISNAAAGLMMNTDGAGPARISDYKSRDGGPLSILDPIGGAVTYSQAAAGAAGSGGGTAYRGSAGVEQWRSTAIAALAAAGQSPEWVGDLLRQMNQESSGNPRAINLTDSNAQRGTPSMGLLQTIQSTFANALSSHGFGVYVPKGPYDPFSNILAGILYTVDRYGSLAHWAANGFGAYDTGGMWPDGTAGYNTSGGKEAVLTPPETLAYKQHAQALAAGYGGTSTGGGQQVTMNVYTQPGQSAADLARELDRQLAWVAR